MNLTCFYKFSSPKLVYEISGKLLPWLAVLATVLMVTGLMWGLIFTPPDYLQGNSYRIIFLHVPTVFLTSSIYILMAFFGAVILIWKIKLADILLKCCAPIGASFCLLALLSGAVWGKPTWGTWWVWDARLTSMLILFFLYLGIIALQESIRSTKTSAKACAVLTLVGLVNIPIIKFSVQWWNTLHQGVTLKLTEKSSIAPEMLWPLLMCIVAFYIFFTVILIVRLRNEILDRKQRTQWVYKTIFSK